LVTGSIAIDKPFIPATLELLPNAHCNAPTWLEDGCSDNEVAPEVDKMTSGLPARSPLNASPAGTPGAVYLVTVPDTTE
jgi:hypothetical protein